LLLIRDVRRSFRAVNIITPSESFNNQTSHRPP
jgi:hypothetical protein